MLHPLIIGLSPPDAVLWCVAQRSSPLRPHRACSQFFCDRVHRWLIFAQFLHVLLYYAQIVSLLTI